MPWASVDAFLSSETFKKSKRMHGWARAKLEKFVAAFNAVFERAKRNGATDERAESLAFPIAYGAAERTASQDTVSKLEPTRHYFAAMAPITAERNLDSTDIGGGVYRFDAVRSSRDMMRGIVAGLAFNWSHDHTQELGVIHDLVMREDLPPAVAAATDPDVQVFFVASYRNDIPAAARNEPLISAEWIATRDGEAIPLTFAASHDPLNAKELAIRRLDVAVAAMLADEKPKANLPPAKSYQAKEGSTQREHHMADPPADPPADKSAGDFATKVASLTTALSETEKRAKDAELKLAALETETKRQNAIIEEMKAAALDQEADAAALKLVDEGCIKAEAVSKFAGLYKKLGKKEFEEMAAALPRVHVGVASAKGAAQPALATDNPDLAKAREAAKGFLKAGA